MVQELRNPFVIGFLKEEIPLLTKIPSQPQGYSPYQTPTPRLAPTRPSLKTMHFHIPIEQRHSLGPWRQRPGTRHRRPTSLFARRPRWVGLLPVEHPSRRLAHQWAPVVLNSNLSRTEPLAPPRAVIVFARTNHAGQRGAQNCKNISQERMLSADDCPYPYLAGDTLLINSKIFALGVMSLGLPWNLSSFGRGSRASSTVAKLLFTKSSSPLRHIRQP